MGDADPIVERSTAIIEGFWDYQKNYSDHKDDRQKTISEIFIEYLNRYIPSTHSIVEQIEVEGKKIIHFKKEKEAKEFVSRYPSKDTVGIELEREYVTIDNEEFDLNYEISQALKPLVKVVFDGDFITALNAGQDNPRIQALDRENRLSEEQIKKLMQARLRFTGFLYKTYICDESMGKTHEERLRKAGQALQALSNTCIRMIEDLKIIRNVKREFWNISITDPIFSELRALTLVDRRSQKTSGERSFSFSPATVHQDMNEGTDFVGTGIPVSREHTAATIRYQAKKHHVIRLSNGRIVVRKGPNVEGEISPRFTGNKEVIVVDPGRNGSCLLYDLDDPDKNPEEISLEEFLEGYVYPSGNKDVYENLTTATKKALKNEEPCFSGWIIITNQAK
jgi:hypothetical protein